MVSHTSEYAETALEVKPENTQQKLYRALDTMRDITRDLEPEIAKALAIIAVVNAARRFDRALTDLSAVERGEPTRRQAMAAHKAKRMESW